MKQIVVLAIAVALAAAGCANDNPPTSTPQTPSGDASQGSLTIDVVYISHMPGSDSVADEIARLFADNPDVTVNRHDVTTPDGQSFASDRGITDKFAVLVNGNSQHTLDGRTLSLTAFPAGQGTSNIPDGDWTLDDLSALVQELSPST